MGLALGLPCVSYSWIRECIEKVCVCIFVNLSSRKFNVYSMASLAFVREGGREREGEGGREGGRKSKCM